MHLRLSSVRRTLMYTTRALRIAQLFSRSEKSQIKVKEYLGKREVFKSSRPNG